MQVQVIFFQRKLKNIRWCNRDFKAKLIPIKMQDHIFAIAKMKISLYTILLDIKYISLVLLLTLW